MLLAPEDATDTNASSVKTAKRKVVLQKSSSKTDVVAANKSEQIPVAEPAFPNDPKAALRDVINSLYAVGCCHLSTITFAN